MDDIKLMPDKYKEEEKAEAETNSAKANFSQLANKITSKSNSWFNFSLAILIIVVLICFGLWGYKNSLAKEKERLTQEIEQLQGQRNLDLEADFVNLKEGIEDFQDIIKTHIYSSNILKMLEELTLPQVRLADLNVDLSKVKITLKIEAASYQILAKQIVVFKEDFRIKEIDTSGVSMEVSGSVGSSLEIELEPSFLYDYE